MILKKKGKIVAITQIRNEADIIEDFVRYHCRIVDRMIVVLHLCTDDTETIVRSLQLEGLPIEIRILSVPGHIQGETFTELVGELTKVSDVEWIVPLDADEFICSNKEDIGQAIRALPKRSVSAIPWKTYVPTIDSMTKANRHLFERITMRKKDEIPQFYKTILPRGIFGRRSLEVFLGNHIVRDKKRQKSLRQKRAKSIWIAHFPVRSADQLKRKIIEGWRAMEANPYRKPQQCYHWKKLYDHLMNEGAISVEELQQIAINYCTQGEPSDIELVKDPLKPN